jgi:hypothetical protein
MNIIAKQTLRRLAQNREAARKSRLRKKVIKSALNNLILHFIFLCSKLTNFCIITGICSAVRNK